ncbi:hypothetical protein D9756_003079 [Leucocoprinus leucothites]|uniref:RNB domain-containing protein n=1 Tax=Leucocoprinus leucothites TaxID=201217 RepID=A0A8H5G6M2_9AGAR|nr:hypothetical protein D9756_003079 [Leucoagaricus leucothites]
MHRTVVRVSAPRLCINQARYASSTANDGTAPSLKRKGKSKAEEGPPPAPKTYIHERSDFSRFTDKLVAKARPKDERGWKHIRSLRGDEMRLKQQVKEGAERSTKAARTPAFNRLRSAAAVKLEESYPSREKEAFNSPDVAEMDESEEVRYTPEAPLGSFVEVRRNDVTESGVVIGSGFKDRQWQMSVLTSSGESWAVLKEDCFFTIPSLCPADLATRCGMDSKPVNGTQLYARIEVLKRLRTLQNEVENATVGISRKLDSIYDTVRARIPREWSEVTVSEVAKTCHKNPTAVEIYATHRVMMNATARFVVTSSYPVSQILSVRPREEVEDLLKVQDWVRDKSPVINEFVTKGLEVAKAQRRMAEESMGEAPSTVPAEHKWTANDLTIIRFLKASLRHTRAVQMDPYSVPLGFIVRRIYGLNVVTHADDYVHRFLVDIGVLAPWQDLIIHDRRNKLDLETNPSVLMERENNILRALENSKDTNPIHPEDFYSVDPLSSVRHDWGDMPVYVIDDVTAEELDDGISVEPIPSEPGNAWIHVHIADPASLIPPTNFLAQKAAAQHETWYTIPKSFPLFPKAIIHHPTRGLSMGQRSRNGSPENVITFSAKVDSNGEIADFTVRAGLIRNVKVINYDSVDAKLGTEYQPPTHPFGGAPIKQRDMDLDPRAIQDLKIVNEYAKRQAEKRLAMNWFSFNRTKSVLQRANTFPPDVDSFTNEALFHRGFPQLTYALATTETDMKEGARNMIAESMKLACRVASMWFLERNIPMIRRCSNPMVPASEESIELLLSARNSYGFINEQQMLKHVIYQPAAFYATVPGMHWGVGVPEGQGYVRVTSPLRRYCDLLAHWQIHRALLQEKRGQTVKGLYDQEFIEKFATSVAVKEQFLKGTQRRHTRYWALLYIKRWQEMFADGKNKDLWPKDESGQPIEDPLQDLEGYFVSMPKLNRLTTETQAQIQIPKLGIKEYLSESTLKRLGYPEIGTSMPVRIHNINLGVKPTMVLKVDGSRS